MNMVDRDEDARKAYEARVKRDAAVKEDDLKAHNKRREDQVKANTEAMRRQDEARPTPTQDENDLARIGHHVMDKEHDGSGPDLVQNPRDEDVRRREMEASGKAGYQTREAAVKPAVPPVAAKPAAPAEPVAKPAKT
jgi:hypothetical protein